ncbi:MAG: hypothetical protein JOZ17_18455 [Acetobacteraceae bacterium]|nr:hypothetical protein [Acetobacteraceae bacterium]
MLALPIVAGATSPWVVWLLSGSIGATGLAVVSLLMAGIYLHFVWWLGDREAELRKRFGRHYTPPSPDIVLAVCMGLAACMIAPGVSAMALVDRVGLPRAAGLVADYDPESLGLRGATIDLSQTIPVRTELEVIPGGLARVVVPRYGNPTAFDLPWTASAAAFCLSPAGCLSVDRLSGRVSVGNEEVGRITSVGSASGLLGKASWEAPWEILTLFRYTEAAPALPQ